MSGLGHIFAEKAGDIVEDLVKDFLGCGDKDDDKDKDNKKGGRFSIFGGNKDEEKGGIFSFGDDKKDDDKGFFSKIFDKDDKEKKSGFEGLFNVHGVEGAVGGNDCEFGGGFEDQGVAVNNGDLFDDLMDVAQETHEGE